MTRREAEAEPELALIAAVAANGVIGRDGRVPWDLPEDIRHFKETTTGHAVIMGRVTYESIAEGLGGPLPDRTNIVLSRGDPDLPAGVIHARSIEEAEEAATEADGDTVYVIGGASVYESFLPRADRLVLTELQKPYDGDTYFPDVNEDAWVEIARDSREGFDFVEYARRDRSDMSGEEYTP